MTYLIDIDKHTSRYALLANTKSDEPREKIGWAVFDEGDHVDGPFVAAYVSENNVDSSKKSNPANVIILKALQDQSGHFERVGLGEIITSEWFDNVPKESIRIY